jgi:hypothetical protein
MVRENDTWYMFLEVLNSDTEQGDIGYATSRDGRDWSYQRIVLDEPFHISYPYVFEWEGTWYMLPETHKAEEVRLYEAVDFPEEWAYAGTVLDGRYADPSILHHEGKWWLFAAPHENNNHRLRLYYADALLGPWTEHPASPIVDWDANIARPGGRMIVYEDRIIRFAQDAEPVYGLQVYAFEITELTPTSYQETQIGVEAILAPGSSDWNSRLMHQVDAHPIGDGRWIACVDGRGTKQTFKLGW